MILQVLFSPRPFFSHSRVVEACAMMLPPMGFIDGPANMLPPSRLAATTCASSLNSWSQPSSCKDTAGESDVSNAGHFRKSLMSTVGNAVPGW